MADHKPSSSETDLTISAHKATDTAAHNLTETPGKVSGTGKGEVISASTWDEFPNGRFGDVKSPAFGVQDPWGGSVSHPVRRRSNHVVYTSPLTQDGLRRQMRLLRSGGGQKRLRNLPLYF